MTTQNRPLPQVNEDSAPYWASARKHALKIQRCSACDRHRFYPTAICHFCGSLDFVWTPIEGTGTVHSYTVVHRAGVGAFAARMPYTVALVTLAEGPVMMANVLTADGQDIDADDPAAEVAIGTRVTVAYEDLTEEVTLPVFVPAVG